MMLFLDGSDIGQLVLGLLADDRASFLVGPKTIVCRPEEYMLHVDAFLNDHVSQEHISGIAVILGPGSATALRASLAFANTFAFTRSIPMYGVRHDPSLDLLSVLSDLSDAQSVPLLRPVYANAVPITQSTKDTLRRIITP